MESHVSSIDTPGKSLFTRKFDTSSVPSIVALTTKKSSSGDKVAKDLRPFNFHPDAIFVTKVSGLPPRVELPVAGSVARLLINAPFLITSSANRAYVDSLQLFVSPRCFVIPICHPIDNAVEPSC